MNSTNFEQWNPRKGLSAKKIDSILFLIFMSLS